MDKEKVIKGMEMCISPNECSPDDCPYYIRPNNESGLCWDRLMTDALDMLKEQDAVEPKQVELYGKDDWYGLVCVCPDCKAEWMSDKDDTHFCPKCGKAVLWE